MCSPICVNRLHNNVRAALKRDKAECYQKHLDEYLRRNKFLYHDNLPSLISPCCRLRSLQNTGKISGEVLHTVDMHDHKKDSAGTITSVTSKAIRVGNHKGFLLPYEQENQSPKKRGFILPNRFNRAGLGFNNCRKIRQDAAFNFQVRNKRFDRGENLLPTANWNRRGTDNPSCRNLSKSSIYMKDDERIISDCSRLKNNFPESSSSLLSIQMKENMLLLNSINIPDFSLSDILKYSQKNSSRTVDKAGNPVFFPGKPSISYQIPETLRKTHRELEPMKTLLKDNQAPTFS